jgi:transcriptional regulator with XRE-family HTH domain
VVKRKRKRSGWAGERKLLDGPIHDRIKQLRTERDIRQVDFAAMVGVHKSVVWHWENRFSKPTIAHLSVIAKVLGVTVAELIRGEDKAAA